MSTNPEDDPELPPPVEVVEPTKERFVDQTPYRIPKATETTPEMRAEYRKRGREKKKRKRRKRRLRNAAVLFLFLTIPVAYVMLTSRSKRLPETNGEALVIPATTFQKLLENGEALALINYCDSLEADVRSADSPTQVLALRKRDQIADRLLELGADEESTNYGIITKINGLMSLTGFDILNEYDENISAKLLKFSSKHVDSAVPKIRNRANLGIVASRIHDYVQDSSEQNFDQVKQTLMQLLDHLTPEININREVREILPLMALSKRDDHIREFKSIFGAKLKQSKDPELRAFGALVFDETVIGSVNFETLRDNVLVPNRDSIIELETIVDTISANPSVSTPVFLCTLGVVENLRRVNEDDLEKQLIDKLRTAMPKIADDATREQVSQALNDYDTRRNLLGKVFDPKGHLNGDEEVQKMPPATVIVFFSFTTSRSAKLISSLNNLDIPIKEKVRFLLVCVDSSLTTDEREQIRAVFPLGSLIGPPENADYLAICPLEAVPYIIILDQDQRVIGVNVDVNQIRGALPTLSKR